MYFYITAAKAILLLQNMMFMKGLGLSAANLIMEAHSGMIEVENCQEKSWVARVRLVFNHAEKDGSEQTI